MVVVAWCPWTFRGLRGLWVVLAWSLRGLCVTRRGRLLRRECEDSRPRPWREVSDFAGMWETIEDSLNRVVDGTVVAEINAMIARFMMRFGVCELHGVTPCGWD